MEKNKMIKIRILAELFQTSLLCKLYPNQMLIFPDTYAWRGGFGYISQFAITLRSLLRLLVGSHNPKY